MSGSGVLERTRAGRWLPLYEPRRDPIRGVAVRHPESYRRLELGTWLVALALDTGDLVTTLLGVPHPGIVEAVPLSRWVLARFGPPGLLVQHVAVLAVLVLLWRTLPRPYRLVVPAVCAWTGYLVMRGNVRQLAAHGVLAVPW